MPKIISVNRSTGEASVDTPTEIYPDKHQSSLDVWAYDNSLQIANGRSASVVVHPSEILGLIEQLNAAIGFYQIPVELRSNRRAATATELDAITRHTKRRRPV